MASRLFLLFLLFIIWCLRVCGRLQRGTSRRDGTSRTGVANSKANSAAETETAPSSEKDQFPTLSSVRGYMEATTVIAYYCTIINDLLNYYILLYSTYLLSEGAQIAVYNIQNHVTIYFYRRTYGLSLPLSSLLHFLKELSNWYRIMLTTVFTNMS